jgi:hypothetical protein
MRRIMMTAAAAVFTATPFAASAAEAVAITAPAGVVRSAQVVQDMPYACGWYGRRCWTIGYAYYYRPYYVYSPYGPYWPYHRPYGYY